MRKLITVLLPSLAIATLGCSDSFTKASRLVEARVLAIQAEPPQPRAGETTVLRPFVYLPKGATATYSWSWCPLPGAASDGYQCLLTDADYAQLAAGLAGFNQGATTPSLTLGPGDTMTFVNPFPSWFLNYLCTGQLPAGMTLSPELAGLTQLAGTFECDVNRFPVQIKLVMSVKLPNAQPGDPLFVREAVVDLNLPTDDTTPTNRNPIIRGLRIAEAMVDSDGGFPTSDDGSSPTGAGSEDAGVPDAGAGDGGVGGEAGGPSMGDDAGVATADAATTADPGAWDAGTSESAGTNGTVLIDDLGSVHVKRHIEVMLVADMPRDTNGADLPGEDASEPYKDKQLGPDQSYLKNPDGTYRIGDTHERLNLSWFSQGGEFDDDSEDGTHTGYNPDSTYADGVTHIPFHVALEQKFKTPKEADYRDSTTEIIVVVRDNRGGVAWTTATLTLDE